MSSGTLPSNSPGMAPCASHSRLWWLRRRDPPLGPLLSRSRDTAKFSDTAIVVRRGNIASIARRIGALSTSTTNPPSRDAFPSARLKRLGADVPPARPPARLRVKRPHNPLLGARAARRCSLCLCPRRRQACRCGPRRRRRRRGRGRRRCTRCARLRLFRLRRNCGCGR